MRLVSSGQEEITSFCRHRSFYSQSHEDTIRPIRCTRRMQCLQRLATAPLVLRTLRTPVADKTHLLPMASTHHSPRGLRIPHGEERRIHRILPILAGKGFSPPPPPPPRGKIWGNDLK